MVHSEDREVIPGTTLTKAKTQLDDGEGRALQSVPVSSLVALLRACRPADCAPAALASRALAASLVAVLASSTVLGHALLRVANRRETGGRKGRGVVRPPDARHGRTLAIWRLIQCAKSSHPDNGWCQSRHRHEFLQALRRCTPRCLCPRSDKW